MKWKTFLLFSLSFLLIAGAFAVPPILLRRTVSKSINRPSLADASSLHLKPAENTVEKLIGLASQEATAVQLEPNESISQLLPVFHEELHTLHASGAIPREVYDYLDAALDEYVDMERFCVIRPAQHLMFEVIVITAFDIQLVFDYASTKILSLSYALFNDELLALELDETQAVRELQGWADYLGLKAGQISKTEMSFEELTGDTNDVNDRRSIRLKQIMLTDEDGNGVPFYQRYELGESVVVNYAWGSE